MTSLEEMRKMINKDPETKHLSVSDLDLFKVYRYLLDRDGQPKKDGYRAVLRTDPYLEIIYQPTKEKAEEIKRNRIKKHLKFYDSEIYIQDAKLADFETFNDERLAVFAHVVHFIEHYKKDHYEKGLYIFGKYRTGKSYLMSAIAQDLAEKHIGVLFVYMPDLVRSIRQGMNEGNLEERINQLKQADVLMMDDIGGENMTPWFRDEVLVPVLQYRLSAKLPVFMTSNLDYSQLFEALAVGKDDTGRIKAARLIQRIKDLTIYTKLAKDSYKDE